MSLINYRDLQLCEIMEEHLTKLFQVVNKRNYDHGYTISNV